MKIWPENCKFQAKIQISRICQIQQILLKWRTLKFAQKTLNISQTLQFEKKIEKLPIEGKFNKIKIILKKLKTQQNFEKIKFQKKYKFDVKLKFSKFWRKFKRNLKTVKD